MVELSRDADVFLDIGAYTGAFTMAVLSANPAAVAHSFEIIPAVIDGLEKNVARNHLGDRVTVHVTGLGKPGTTMQVPSGDGGSALPSFYGTGMDFDAGAQVRFTSLDELLPDLPPSRPQVTVKIDVEGAEHDVLGNGRELLATLQPDILCEVLDDRAQPEQLMSILDRFDYHYYLVGHDHLRAHDEIVPDRQLRDWLFTTKNPEDMRVAGYPVR